jgi:hypothetical protein
MLAALKKTPAPAAVSTVSAANATDAALSAAPRSFDALTHASQSVISSAPSAAAATTPATAAAAPCASIVSHERFTPPVLLKKSSFGSEKSNSDDDEPSIFNSSAAPVATSAARTQAQRTVAFPAGFNVAIASRMPVFSSDDSCSSSDEALPQPVLTLTRAKLPTAKLVAASDRPSSRRCPPPAVDVHPDVSRAIYDFICGARVSAAARDVCDDVASDATANYNENAPHNSESC